MFYDQSELNEFEDGICVEVINAVHDLIAHVIYE